MGGLLRRRSRGQTIPIAALFMVGIVGALSLVIDSGMFFVIQHQFQAAADGAALAAAWYPPICPFPNDPTSGCHPSSGSLTPDAVAAYYVHANTQTAALLCGQAPTVTVTAGTQLNVPAKVNVVVVTVECDAGFSFGRILGLTSKHISGSAAAGIGSQNPITHDLDNLTTPPLIARLIA